MHKILSNTGKFQHGGKTTFIPKDAKEKIKKLAHLSFQWHGRSKKLWALFQYYFGLNNAWDDHVN